MGTEHLALGRSGEDRAARWYIDHGYRVLARNWRCRAGEIDLVCTDGRDLVISEVKTRRRRAAGEPSEAVTRAKQQRLRRLAVLYLGSLRTTPGGRRTSYETIRFDVVSIVGDSLQVLEDAF